MININLLPWREEQQEQNRKSFLASLVALVLLLVAVTIGVHIYFKAQIRQQDSRNLYLLEQVQSYQRQIYEISNLKKEQQVFQDRMKVIQGLQVNRPESVRLFQALAEMIPQGIYVDSIIRAKDQLMMTGYAESNSHISHLMKNIQASNLLENPRLVKIGSREGEFKRDFELIMLVRSGG